MKDEFGPGDCAVIDAIVFDVFGDPAPQGSKKAFLLKKGPKRGKIVMVEMSKKVKPWRFNIEGSARLAAEDYEGWVKHEEGPVSVSITFWLPYPKTPKWKRLGRPDKTPDLDKLIRSTLDGLSDSGVIYGDDKQVVNLNVSKDYVREGERTGARIRIASLRECAKPHRKVKK